MKEVATPAELVVVMTVLMVEVTGSAVVEWVEEAALALVVSSLLLPADVVLVFRVVGAAVAPGVVLDAGALADVVGSAAGDVVVTTATVVLVTGAAVVVVVTAAADVVV